MTNPFSFLPLGLFILLLCDLLRMLHSLLLPFAKARKELMAGGGIEINFLGLAVHFSPFRLRPHDFDSPLLLTEREGFGKTNTKKYSNTGGGSVERIGENWRFFFPFFSLGQAKDRRFDGRLDRLPRRTATSLAPTSSGGFSDSIAPVSILLSSLSTPSPPQCIWPVSRCLRLEQQPHPHSGTPPLFS